MTVEIPVKDYVDVIARGLQDEVDRRFADLYRQIDQARKGLNHRLNGMNEFRQSLTEVSGQMAPRTLLDHVTEEINKNIARIDSAISDINAGLAQMRGRQAAYTSGLVVLISIISVALYAVNIIR